MFLLKDQSFHTPRTSGLLFVRALMMAACCVFFISGCSTSDSAARRTGSVSFIDYQNEALEHLRKKRIFQSENIELEVQWNAPREWRPVANHSEPRPAKGILLVHGLGDSPWSFHDIGQELAEMGFLVRTVLLPGHGTSPQDLLDATLEQWREVLQAQVAALERDVDEIYLGGFSTGANLVLEHAYTHPKIAGLLLFSPGFRSDSSVDWLAPLVSWVRPWLTPSDGQVPMQNPVRYLNTPTNGFAQFYRSSVAVRRLLQQRAYDKPVLMVVAQHDSVLDTAFLLDTFQRRFTHPASRLIWYGVRPIALTDSKRVFVRTDVLPQHRISQFSHMAVLFSPDNHLYGARGSSRFCWNGQAPADLRACEEGSPVWYSDWGYREVGKIHARLTFNPYFDWQTAVAASVLKSSDTPVEP